MLEPALIEPARVVGPPAWVGHIPFASWIMARQRPAIFVELGTHTGNSYSAFCQSAREYGLDAKCYAVDTWQGDEHAGHYDDAVFNELSEYHNKNYEAFSRLLRMTFDEALSHFSDGSIDLLHIDGLHTYEAVKHDFEAWLPKLSRRGVVLFHDTNERERGFGVWKLWEELCGKYPSMHFEHSHGLGALFVGPDIPAEIQDMLEIYQADALAVKKLFACLGQRIAQQYELAVLNRAVAQRDGDIANLWQAVAERDAQMAKRDSDSDGYIADLKQVVAERDAQIARRDGDIANLWQAVAERDAQIAAFQQAVAERDAQIAAFHQSIDEFHRAVAERDAQVSTQVETIQKIYRSRSWRWTGPLRFLARLLSGRLGNN